MVLGTDANKSVAIFIYDDIQWGGGAQIGFNAGDGHTQLMLSEALTDRTLNINNLTNIDQRGIFAFRIDSKFNYEYHEVLVHLSQI